jgi:hypothetical protein
MNPEDIGKAFDLLNKILIDLTEIQKHHNKMFLDVYERITKLEEEKNG